jgi:hypothetical protein
MADNYGNGLSTFFPAMLNDGHGALHRPNLRQSVDQWREAQNLEPTDIFFHVVATMHAPAYRAGNDSALRMDWPRIPLPGKPDLLRTSADLGARVARLLDVEQPVAGVSEGALLSGLGLIAVPKGKSFALSVGWGHVQTNKNGSRIVMPATGRLTERNWTDAERVSLAALADRHELTLDALLNLIGSTAVDVHMNADAKWEGVPANAWSYTLGGYQVLKKWLSYREAAVLGRPLTGDEALHFAASARRITAILCMGPALDAAHAAASASAIQWVDGKPAPSG